MRRLYVWILGVLDGALYSLVMLLVVWQIQVYEDARNIREAAGFGHLPVQLTSNERWAPIVATWILLFAVAAPVVNHFWPQHRGRSIWFWEAVGLIAVSAWNVLLLIAFWAERQGSGQALSYDWLTSSSNPIFGPISLGTVLVVNLVYAFVIQIFEKTIVRH